MEDLNAELLNAMPHPLAPIVEPSRTQMLSRSLSGHPVNVFDKALDVKLEIGDLIRADHKLDPILEG